MNVTVIDYGVGNLRSLQRGLERADASVRISSDPAEIAAAEALVLPGVGAFEECIRNSKSVHDVLVEAAADTPILGICVGFQLMFTESTEGAPEGGTIPGLDLLDGRVERLPADGVKVPHMGWNELTVERDHPLVDGIEDGAYAYFVHSYGSAVDAHTVASCECLGVIIHSKGETYVREFPMPVNDKLQCQPGAHVHVSSRRRQHRDHRTDSHERRVRNRDGSSRGRLTSEDCDRQTIENFFVGLPLGVDMTLTTGVVAVQGDVSEHAAAIERAARANGEQPDVREIRTSGIVPECDVLLMPGGESTAISRLLDREGIAPEIVAHVEAGRPMLATCAGLIVAATDPQDDRVDELGVLDVTVERNAFGRQKDSFEAPLDVTGLDGPFPAVFIRAPVVSSVGPDIEVLATWEEYPVAVRQGPVVGTSFHPELTGDSRIHDLAFFETATRTV